MRVLIAPLLLLLSGCWIGERLYSAADSHPALPPGVYRSLTEDERGLGRVSILPNGMTHLAGDDDSPPSILGFAPLDGEGRRFVIWSARESDGATTDDVGLYGLLVDNGGGEYLFFMPMCELTAEIARTAGALVQSVDGVPVCRFPTRASLEAALRRYTPRPEEAMGRLVLVDAD